MVGLNHEFARKLLWRDYPTDQRGSYFRQFWSVGDTIDSEGLSEDPLEGEALRHPGDPPLGAGLRRSASTTTACRPVSLPAPQAVLVIRGELLKKYPNDGDLSPSTRKIGDGTVDCASRDWLARAGRGAEPAAHRRSRTPLYRGARPIDDIFFFGFDLTIDQAKGSTGRRSPAGSSSCKERPGEAAVWPRSLARSLPIETVRRR